MINDMGFEVKTIKLIDAGTYDFIIHGVVGIGLRKPFSEITDKGFPASPVVNIKIIFELPDLVNDEGLGEVIGTNFPLSIHGKSSIYRLMFSCLGASVNGDFNKQSGVFMMKPDFLSSEGLKGLLGKNGVLTITQKESKNGGVYAAIDKQSITSLHPKAPIPKMTRETFFFNPNNPDTDIFNNTLTYWTQKEIMEALNMSTFPKELHDAWVKIQDTRMHKENSDSNMQQSVDMAGTDTSSIE